MFILFRPLASSIILQSSFLIHLFPFWLLLNQLYDLSSLLLKKLQVWPIDSLIQITLKHFHCVLELLLKFSFSFLNVQFPYLLFQHHHPNQPLHHCSLYSLPLLRHFQLLLSLQATINLHFHSFLAFSFLVLLCRLWPSYFKFLDLYSWNHHHLILLRMNVNLSCFHSI